MFDFFDSVIIFFEAIFEFIGTFVSSIVSFFQLLFGLHEWGTPVLAIFPPVIMTAYLLTMVIAIVKAILGR